MDKNTITGLVLIAAVLFGYSFWANRNAGKYAEEHPAEKVEDTKPKALQQTSLAETPSHRVALLRLTAKKCTGSGNPP